MVTINSQCVSTKIAQDWYDRVSHILSRQSDQTTLTHSTPDYIEIQIQAE